ncbi:MAG: hypothetical protein KatS3mg110_2194 [Pirellulaceae bacterium]|nr:MAG: hypothetical protein KatS3mg110_2194 [Pirellulaceae bacterium]
MASGLPNEEPLDEQRLMRRRPTVDPELAESWYVDLEGTVLGPISAHELLDRVRQGEVTADTPVRKGDSQWVKAGEVNGLFEAAFRRAFAYRCPYCGAEVDKPPTVCLGCDREITAVYRVSEQPRVERRAASSSPASAGNNRPPVAEHSSRRRTADEQTVLHSIVRWIRGWWG